VINGVCGQVRQAGRAAGAWPRSHAPDADSDGALRKRLRVLPANRFRKIARRWRRRGNASSAGRQLATHHGVANLAGVFSFRAGAFWPGVHLRMILAGK